MDGTRKYVWYPGCESSLGFFSRVRSIQTSPQLNPSEPRLRRSGFGSKPVFYFVSSRLFVSSHLISSHLVSSRLISSHLVAEPTPLDETRRDESEPEPGQGPLFHFAVQEIDKLPQPPKAFAVEPE